jgi:hypothetical protein
MEALIGALIQNKVIASNRKVLTESQRTGNEKKTKKSNTNAVGENKPAHCI